MLTAPQRETRPVRPYAFVRFTVPMTDMKRPAEEGFPLLFDHLARRGVTPAGAPFFNYRRIDMADTLDVEAGVTVDHPAADGDHVRFGQLPAGNFITMTHTGHFDGLYDATAMLIGWAAERGIAWDMHASPDGDHFACRLEIYETDPDEEPDPGKWVTRLEFKTAD